ncbi:MAG: uracil-DNA glycosylase [Verrucomicrobiales bacterium]|nr:uracil-DNA glycosylase [Verrucomicrobiales bacterium]
MNVPDGWKKQLDGEIAKPYFAELVQFVNDERKHHIIHPADGDVFAALAATPFQKTRVLLLGQDPYHGEDQAHGLSFSVRDGVPFPRSLRNIFKELQADQGCEMPKSGCLLPWARQGVLLLNAVLTVRTGEANSHKAKGWETFTDAIIRVLNEEKAAMVFLLWGGYAFKKAELIDSQKHRIIRMAHPSPLSASRGFFGSKPFSKTNNALKELEQQPIDWCLS